MRRVAVFGIFVLASNAMMIAGTSPFVARAGAQVSAPLASVVALTSDSGSSTSCAVITTGRVNCWGSNANGELGNGTTTGSDVPVVVTGIADAKAIADDNDGRTFCALLSNGTVECWGYNGYGELGNGTTTTYTVPVAVKKITTAKAIIGGDYDFCALLTTSQIDCWGYNNYGELGNGTTTSSDVPVAVHGISNASKMIAGYYNFCALLTTKHLSCWGYNGDGQLGDGNTTSSDVPVTVTGITGAKAVTSDTGGDTTCALLSTNRVDCWGANSSGELGNGTTTSSDVPVAVHKITNAKAIADDNDGRSFCAVLSTASVDCWGYNGYGELGNATTTTYTVPVPVKKITTAKTIVGGQDSFCSELSTGQLNCWGYNGYGQLGNATTTNSDVPVAVHGISDASKLVVGYYNTCSLLTTKGVDCWGYNGSGQLGDGNTTSSDVPVAVVAAS